MPLSSDPDARFPFWLKSDGEKPEATRPTFIGRFLTRRQVSKLLALEEQATAASQAGNVDEANALRDRAVAVGLVGWRNMTDPDGKPVPFATTVDAEGNTTIPALDDVMSHYEKIELLTAMYSAGHMSEVDRRNLSSPLR